MITTLARAEGDVTTDAGDDIADSKSPEELLIFTEEELVTVATKRKVALKEAPANVTVITHDEIVRSPEIGIPEILRRVAGVDVITVTAAESDISPRGFATTVLDGDRISVLVDGRTVNLASFGSTVFSELPVSRYDIKRIEVIKGPMSSLYGDRSLLGTINIVTFDPDETRTLLAGGGGMYWDGRGDFIHAGEFTEGLWYKVSGTYRRADEFDDVNGDGRDKDLEKFGARGIFEWKPSDKTRLRLTGGISDSDLALQVAGISRWNLRDGFVMGDAEHDFGKGGKLAFKVWWRRTSGKSDNLFNANFRSGTNDSVTTEIRDTWEFDITDWVKNITTVGFEYRLITKGSFTSAQDLHNLAGYLQSEMRFWEKLFLTGGFRFDYQKDFTDFNTSAHGSIVWLAHPKYTTKLSVSTAFNTPTFFNLFLDLVNIPFTNFSATARGNRNLKSERIFYVDFSNIVRPLDWLALRGDVFYYRMQNLITPQLRLTAPNNFLMTYQNQGGAEAIGGEAGIEAEVVKGVNLYANWAYQHFKPISGNPYSTPNLGNPLNKVNAGVNYVSNFGLFVNLDFHWIQAYRRQAGAVANFPNTPSVGLDDQFLLNARVGYQPVKDHLEIAVIANNILNERTPQIPAVDPVFNIPMAERPHFRLLGTLSYTF